MERCIFTMAGIVYLKSGYLYAVYPDDRKACAYSQNHWAYRGDDGGAMDPVGYADDSYYLAV